MPPFLHNLTDTTSRSCLRDKKCHLSQPEVVQAIRNGRHFTLRCIGYVFQQDAVVGSLQCIQQHAHDWFNLARRLVVVAFEDLLDRLVGETPLVFWQAGQALLNGLLHSRLRELEFHAVLLFRRRNEDRLNEGFHRLQFFAVLYQ